MGEYYAERLGIKREEVQDSGDCCPGIGIVYKQGTYQYPSKGKGTGKRAEKDGDRREGEGCDRKGMGIGKGVALKP